MHTTFRKVMYVLIFVVLLALIGTVLAHEEREVEGYDLEFGWRNEPALVGFPNGPELYVSIHDEHEGDHEEGDDHDHADEAASAMADVEVSLQVEVTFGPASTTLSLERDFADPGHFIAELIPTRPGDYSFRVFGSIGSTEMDEVFTSADGQFGTVEPAGDITFPDDLPSIVDLLERITQLEARVQELEAGQ